MGKFLQAAWANRKMIFALIKVLIEDVQETKDDLQKVIDKYKGA